MRVVLRATSALLPRLTPCARGLLCVPGNVPLTLFGANFGTALLDLGGNTNTVKIAGQPCVVTQRRDDRIVCTTPVGRYCAQRPLCAPSWLARSRCADPVVCVVPSRCAAV